MRFTFLALAAIIILGAEERIVISVQLRGGAEVSSPTVNHARATAARIFTQAGFGLEWCTSPKKCSDWPDRVIVTLEPHAPTQLSGFVLAGAQVFEGRNIRIYLDRLRASVSKSRVPALLAHVLVHEITHILQACDRHARTGVMKARWDDADYAAMERAPLAFTSGDIDLVRAGFSRRRNASALAPSPAL